MLKNYDNCHIVLMKNSGNFAQDGVKVDLAFNCFQWSMDMR